jgi:hypothetical protein
MFFLAVASIWRKVYPARTYHGSRDISLRNSDAASFSSLGKKENGIGPPEEKCNKGFR